MNTALLISLIAVPAVSGIVGTRLWVKRRQQNAVSSRLSRWVAKPVVTVPLTLLKRPKISAFNWQFVQDLPGMSKLKNMLIASGLEDQLNNILLLMSAFLFLPILFAFALDLNILVALCLGISLLGMSFISLKMKSNALRTKFCTQLPDAIDLIVSVLRSGHSVAQAVKAVADEIPSPCGKEFETILHRMNLGQPLSQSLLLSAQRFHSYELDLIRRAVAIQIEVGGSLAELLDKTNTTLRERLKLARQLGVVTAQSRLSAQIIGLMPVFLAIGLNVISPGYLQILIEDSLGRTLLGISIALEIVGIYIMRRMSTMKV